MMISYPWIYISLPTQGKIVDAISGKPLQGVMVLANWELSGGMYHTKNYGQIFLTEAITDDRGVYKIPFWVRVPLRGSLKSWAPVI